MDWKKSLCLIVFLEMTRAALADPLSFPEVWNQVNSGSAMQESARLQVQAISESKDRAGRHWLPRLYFEARAYQTNDPGYNFIGLLEQRSLQSTDFSTSSINDSGTNLFSRGAIGLDLPFYEGGLRISQLDALSHEEKAQQIALSQVQLDQYSQVGFAYGSIAVIENQKAKIEALLKETAGFQKNYKLGSKSNPVGYSGLLGIHALSNRLSSLTNQWEAQLRSQYAQLQELGVRSQSWSPIMKNPVLFIKEYYPTKTAEPDQDKSFQMESMDESVRAKQASTQAEKSKFLPRIGAFAESYTFNGNRDTATGYNAGVYLRWNLFDPGDYGTLNEAKLKALSAQKGLESQEQQERAERSGLKEQFLALVQNLDLLNDSDQLLGEQIRASETLFQNGSINALQMLEVLNRRADLIVAQTEAELNLLKTATQIAAKEKWNLPQALASGGNNAR